MDLDHLQNIINNGFVSMRQPDADEDKRIKTLEVMASILKKEAENIKKIFTRFFIEFLCAGQLFQHHQKAGLLASFMEYLRQAFGQRIIVFRKLLRKVKRFCNRTQHLLARQRVRAVRIQEVLTQTYGLLLQFSDPKCADGLYDIGRYGTKQTAGRDNFRALFLAL